MCWNPYRVISLSRQKLMTDEHPAHWAEAWNFGPIVSDEASVAELATGLVKAWGGGHWTTPSDAPKNVEAKTLRIAIDKAISLLDWQPRWNLEATISRTVNWYRTYYQDPGASMRDHSLGDISAYESSGFELPAVLAR